jgi:hypothetical protein
VGVGREGQREVGREREGRRERERERERVGEVFYSTTQFTAKNMYCL